MTNETPAPTRSLYQVAEVQAPPKITTRLARNGYYQVFDRGNLVGHVYLNPREKGWLARRHYRKDVTEHRTRDEAVARIAETAR